ncbi:sarcosine oxidase subunit alpha family protein [Xanthobacter sp. AM11]|uniref:sarcosine oxidase subunit alpha family protein n=1 Tax=Xanthobacter sp. AM11 TaxID=3380643 RepID=UPI0039BFC23B
MTRLSAGGLIDRSRTLSFTFDGRRYSGHPGDTLASALLANGVRLMGRSFKYHRPRGVVTAGSEEPNALVELRSGARREPNTRATTVEVFDGLEAASQNRWPSLAFDLLSVNRLAAPVLGAGFYYKTFMWPAAFWEKVYEPMIRRAAGLGRAADAPDPDTYEKATAFCDVLVIGSGAAGLAAALAAGRAGARVILAEEDFRLGGRLLAERATIDDAPALDFVAKAEAELSSLPQVRLMPRTTVFGAYDGGEYGAVERMADHLPVPAPFQPRQRLWRIVAKRCVLAAGAFDRPIVFPGNDRPGVMSALALATYANRYGVGAGASAAVFCNNDHAVAAALDAAAAGLRLEALIDVRPAVAEGLAARAKALGVRLIASGEVVATSGKCLSSITVRTPGGSERLAVEALGVSGGATPNVNLACHMGGKPRWQEDIAAFVPGALPPGMAVAGAVAGRGTLARCLADGTAAGAAAAADAGFAATPAPAPVADETPAGLASFWQVKAKGDLAFVDLQNDVSAKDVAIAHLEGFRAVELLKRYTTLGMATDQGKTSNMAGLAIMAELTGQSIPTTGTTLFRPPYTPVALGTLAGHHRGVDFKPTRPTPTHAWAQAQGAVFVEAGLWLRAQYFPQPGETDWQQSVNREVMATRSAVGVIDVSTFGKIDLQGPDVGALLDRVYINTFSTLPVGKARYGVMLREDGLVMDDGTTARLADHHFVMTTTTANAAKVFQHLEFCLQVLWPELDVALASVSEQWAQIAISGPRAREVLARIADGRDVSNAALPFMGAVEGTVMGGVAARIFRLSFSGELGYEIAVPARHGEALMRALMAAGEPFGITPYGTEALGVMRIEKGHVSGNELSGRTSARDLGLGRMASTRKDHIGRVMAARPGIADPDRPALVGLRPVDRGARLRAGAILLSPGAAPTTANDEGYITSVAFSPTLGHAIGLGLLKRGPARLGETVRAYDPVRGGDMAVEVCSPAFVDPEGEKQRG